MQNAQNNRIKSVHLQQLVLKTLDEFNISNQFSLYFNFKDSYMIDKYEYDSKFMLPNFEGDYKVVFQVMK